MDNENKCPVMHGALASNSNSGTSNKDWWPNQLNLSILHQHDSKSDPMDDGFNYRDEFAKLDYESLKKDLNDSLVIHLINDKQDSLILFVVAKTEIDEKDIRDQLKEQCSPRHLPDHIIRVPDIPYTLSGKKVEIPIKRLLMGTSINNILRLETLRNPESIKWFIEYAKIKDFT